jgi:hypothetical protein
LPPFVLNALSLNDEQRDKVTALQTETNGKIRDVFNDEQENQLNEMRSGTGVVGVVQPGQVFSAFQLTRFNLTPEQQTQMTDLQKHVDDKLREILTEEQRTQLSQFAAGGPRGLGGPDARGRGGRGGRGGGGPQGSSVFRVYRYGPEYAGLAGKDLAPGKTLEEISRATQTAPPQEGPAR